MTRRRVMIVVVRLVAGLGGLALVAGVVTASALADFSGPQASAPHRTVTPVAHDQTWVCPGALSTLGADGDETDQTSPVGAPTVTVVGDDLTDEPLAADGVPDDAAARALVAAAGDDAAEPPAVAAAQSQWVDDEHLRGLAASACGAPSFDSWLVGGSTQGGSTTLLVLANPAAVAATVETTVYSDDGEPTEATTTLAAGAQQIVSLAGQSPDDALPVVHVRAAGGRVVARLQQSRVTGITPDGIDWVDSGAAPSRELTIPGVAVRSAETTGDEDDPIVRLAVPGETDAQVTVSVTPAGHGKGMVREATVSARSSAEIPLEGLADGDYTVTVSSDEPVAAGARTVSAVDGARDLAWFSSAPRLGATALVAGPEGGELVVANPGDDSHEVVLTGPGDTSRSRTLEAGDSTVFALPDAGQYTLEQASSLVAAVTIADDAALASYPVAPARSLPSPLTLYPR